MGKLEYDFANIKDQYVWNGYEGIQYLVVDSLCYNRYMDNVRQDGDKYRKKEDVFWQF